MQKRFLLIPLLYSIAFLAPAHAQNTLTLTPYVPVEGSISAAGASESWTFAGREGEVISVDVQSADDGLDPNVALSNTSGEVLTQNDDIAYPGNTDALLQAVTLPANDTYTVTVSGYGETSGGFTLTLMQGYSEVLLAENFNGDSTTWNIASDNLAIDIAAGQLTLSLSGIGANGYALNDPPGEYRDFYADAVIATATGRNGWIAGLTLRQDGSDSYRLSLNHQGQWRFSLVTASGEQPLRDWTNHPAIVAGEERFTLGVLGNGGTFDIFYNNVFVGQVSDSEQTLTSGGIGLYVGTINNAGSETQVGFDSLTVTAPRTLGDDEILPDQIVAGTQALTIQELQRRRVIPTGGELALTVPESFGQRATPGVNRVLLGRGTTFGDLVIGTTLNWQTAAAGTVGCGLIFGSVSESEYTLAYIDQTGSYGLSPRTGDTFAPGIFGTNSEWTEGSQTLVVVKLGDTARYYVNQQHVGTMQVPETEGEIGVAVVNYETIDTTCEFNDTWVWRLDR